MRVKLRRLRLSLRSLAVLIALVAVALWAVITIWSPTRRLNYLLRLDQPDYIRRDLPWELAHTIPFWEMDRAVSSLVTALDHPTPRVRMYAADDLPYLGPRAERAVPRLIAALNDEDISVRAHTIRVLESTVSWGSANRNDVVPALTLALHEQHPHLQLDAAAALARIGETRKAAEVLLAAWCVSDPYLRNRARETINWVNNPGPFVDVLVRMIQVKDRRMRDAVFAALVQDGPRGILISALRSALTDPDPEIRQWAIHLLESIDSAP